MKGLFIVGLLMAAVLANPISDRLDKLESNLTHLWGMVHDMEEHHGDGVHIHLETHDESGEHHHETSHLDTKGNDAHVYLHMDMHDPFDEMVTMTEYSGMGHDHHDDHDEHDDDHSDEDPDMHGEHSGHKKMVHHHHHHHHHHHGHNEMKEAHCDLVPNSADKPFKGHIHMKQLEGNLMSVHVDFDCPSDVKPGSKLALHVHEGSDMSQKCDSLGGHYNPHGVKHGARTDSHNHRHVGDWSNVVCDINNEVDHEFYERMTQLSGPHSILNRSIVLHLGADDHGMGESPESKKSGAAGNRFACCIIREKLD